MKQASFNFMAADTICSYFGAQENKICPVSTFSSSIFHEVMGPDAMILVLLMLSFKPAFHSLLSLSSRGSFFFFIIGDYFILFFNFTILYWFCNTPQVYSYGYESMRGIQVFPILNPPPSSLPVPSLWVVPVHQPQASSIVHQTLTGDSFHIYCTCFNAILPNLPTLSLSHRVQKNVLYISVSFAVSYTGLLLPSF